MLLSLVLLQAACSLSLGLGEQSMSASSVLVMPMVSSRTTGFRGTILERAKFIPVRSSSWSYPSIDDDDVDLDHDDAELQDTRTLLS